ncbi:MAG: hypothetical protein EHM47_13955, partial [Ignavibacteriales bacterium]
MKKYIYLLTAPVIALLLFLIFPSVSGVFTLENAKTTSAFDKHTYPYEWAWIQKTYPHYNADDDVYIKAIEHVKRMKASQTDKHLSNIQWEFAGPINIGGRVVDIEFNPQDPDIV